MIVALRKMEGLRNHLHVHWLCGYFMATASSRLSMKSLLKKDILLETSSFKESILLFARYIIIYPTWFVAPTVKTGCSNSSCSCGWWTCLWTLLYSTTGVNAFWPGGVLLSIFAQPLMETRHWENTPILQCLQSQQRWLGSSMPKRPLRMVILYKNQNNNLY